MAIAVIQARMGSTRLPGKVLRDLGGRPVLSWVIRAARASGAVDAVVVATTVEPVDDAVVALADAEGVPSVRGSVDDVLTRFTLAMDLHPGAAVIRLTGDCPLLDPTVIAAAAAAQAAAGVDYLSTVTPRSLPRGLDVEVAAAAALRVAASEATGTDRVHVMPFLYSNPDRFTTAGLVFAPAADDLRVTLDTTEDAALLDGLVEVLGDRPPAWRDVVRTLRARPDLVALNRDVRQKDPSEG